jgi:hypothetical protein
VTAADDRAGPEDGLADPQQLEKWPRLLRPLLAQHGVRRVEGAGLEALGYPAGWIHTYKEVAAIGARLAATKE